MITFNDRITLEEVEKVLYSNEKIQVSEAWMNRVEACYRSFWKSLLPTKSFMASIRALDPWHNGVSTTSISMIFNIILSAATPQELASLWATSM